MRVTVEINEITNTAISTIKLHNVWSDSDKIEIEIDERFYRVNAKELIRAINACMLISDI